MFLVASHHVRYSSGTTRFARLQAPTAISQLISLDGEALQHAEWAPSVDSALEHDTTIGAEIVPLYTCFFTPTEATFHLISHYRRGVAHLVEGWSCGLPAIADPANPDLFRWLRDTHSQSAALNIGPARFGLRPDSDMEVETKFTLPNSCDPLALALSIMNALESSTPRPSFHSTGLTHRVLRSQIYGPVSRAESAYASFTERPHGGLWAKAKFAASADRAVRRELHHVAPDIGAGLLWAQTALGTPLHRIGKLTRTCWDMVTEPDNSGDMCIITVDHSTMSDITLCQVEIEYAARHARVAATSEEARKHVDAISTDVGGLLSHLALDFRHDDLGKVDFYRQLREPGNG